MISLVGCVKVRTTKIGYKEQLVVQEISSDNPDRWKYEVWAIRAQGKGNYFSREGNHDGFGFIFYAPPNMYEVGDTVYLSPIKPMRYDK